jgi:hypothetical protein
MGLSHGANQCIEKGEIKMVSEAKKRANEKWDKENIRRFVLKVAKNTEKDILEKLEAQDNVNGYIKSLIRADINKGVMENE